MKFYKNLFCTALVVFVSVSFLTLSSTPVWAEWKCNSSSWLKNNADKNDYNNGHAPMCETLAGSDGTTKDDGNATWSGAVPGAPAPPPANVHNGVFVPTKATPDERADEYCKYKYPSDTAQQDACKDGYKNGDPDQQTCPKYDNKPNGAALAKACSDGWSQGVAAGDNKNKHETTQATPPAGQRVPGSISGTGQKGGNKSCSAVKTGILECADDLGMAGPFAVFIRVLSVCAGIVAVAGLAWGGFRYASAGGNADQAQQGMSAIRNTIIGMLIFVSLVAIANFIVPGTLFG